MSKYNAINNATALGSGNLILGLGSGNSTYDVGTSVHNTFTGQFIAPTMTSNATSNTGNGYACLGSITSAHHNSAYGATSLISLLTGKFNIGLGYGSGSNYSAAESSNIVIGNSGVNAESHVLRIGQTGSSDQQQNKAYIGGIASTVITDPTGYDVVMMDPLTDQLVLSSSTTKITTYDTPGNYTWTKAAGTKVVMVIGFCGGCGGGSGRKGSAGVTTGGGGGSAGSCFLMQSPAMFFDATEPVVVGAGGNGGAAQVTDATDGNPGSVGGVSYFAGFKPALSAAGSAGNSIIANGFAATKVYIYNQNITVGAAGSGNSNVTTAGNAVNTGYNSSTQPMTATSGGGGATIGIGGNGGTILMMDGSSAYIAGGPGGLINADGQNGTDALTSTAGGLITGGTGGGGGGAGGGSSGYKGGNGGFPGGGGGGGSSGLNSTWSSGAGGAGGNGRIIVIEFM